MLFFFEAIRQELFARQPFGGHECGKEKHNEFPSSYSLGVSSASWIVRSSKLYEQPDGADIPIFWGGDIPAGCSTFIPSILQRNIMPAVWE